jgi:DNA invertase Pin-like site-specific DNA recombinase
MVRDYMLLGYARVSTNDQNLDRQIDQLKEYGCERIYQEKITGTKKERPEFEKLIDNIRPRDTIIITELTRLSRSTKDLFSIVDIIEKKGANIKSLKESWIDTTTPQGKLLFTIFAGISQFERDLISQRTKEGLNAARARGRKGGRPFKETKTIELALKMYDSKDYTISEITTATGLSKSCIYSYVKSRK